jgi:hypothetical protein
VASYDPAFRLDTDAYVKARRVRTARTTVYWLALILAACGVAAALALVAGSVLAPSSPGAHAAKPAPVQPAPPPAQTQVAVWSLRHSLRPATRMAGRLTAAGYALAATRTTKPGRLRGTWIMYAPGSESAALAVGHRIGVKPSRVTPLDGVDPSRIAPATVLVLLGP